MTARESLANSKHKRRVGVCMVLLTVLASICLALMTASAQQDSGQQRPRRVGQGQTPQPKATPTPQATTRPTEPGDEVGEGDVVRVETQLVSVPAVVTDGAGHPVAGLRAENFRIFENGQLQSISNFATSDA